MTEAKLQSLMVIDFSQKRPDEKGLLWSTKNNNYSLLDGVKQKAMGMVAGASDLNYFKQLLFTGIEVKLPGAKHKREHIQKQYDWGCKIESEGGKYYIATTMLGFWSIINGHPIAEYSDVYTLGQVKMLLDQGKSTIVF